MSYKRVASREFVGRAPSLAAGILQLPLKMFFDELKQVRLRRLSGNPVGLVGIDHQANGLSALIQRVDHLNHCSGNARCRR